jgi:hypothetical protein
VALEKVSSRKEGNREIDQRKAGRRTTDKLGRGGRDTIIEEDQGTRWGESWVESDKGVSKGTEGTQQGLN